MDTNSLRIELQKKEMQLEGYEYDLQDLSAQLSSVSNLLSEKESTLSRIQSDFQLLNSEKLNYELDYKKKLGYLNGKISLLDSFLKDKSKKVLEKSNFLHILERDLESAQVVLSRHEVEKKELESKIFQLETAIGHDQKQLASQVESNKKLEALNAQLSTEKDHLSSQLEEFSLLISALNADIEQSRLKFEKCETDLGIQKRISDTLSGEKQDLVVDLRAALLDKDQSLQDLQHMKADLETKDEDLKFKENQIAELKDETMRLAATLEDVNILQTHLEAMNDRTCEMENELKQVVDLYSESINALQTNQKEIQDLKQRHANDLQNISLLQTAMDEKQLALSSLEEMYSSLLSKFSSLETELNQERLNLTTLQKKHEQTLSEFMELEKQQRHDQSRLQALLEDADEKQKTIEYLEAHETEAQTINLALSKKVSDYETDIKNLKVEITLKQSLEEALKTDKTRLEQSIEKLKEEKEEMSDRLSAQTKESRQNVLEFNVKISKAEDELAIIREETERLRMENADLKQKQQETKSTIDIKKMSERLCEYAETIENLTERVKLMDELQDKCLALTQERDRMKLKLERLEIKKQQQQSEKQIDGNILLKRANAVLSPLKSSVEPKKLCASPTKEKNKENLGMAESTDRSVMNGSDKKFPVLQLGKPPMMPSKSVENQEKCAQQ